MDDGGRLDPLREAAARYAVAITPAMAALIDCSDANDPIARQFEPSAAELSVQPEELSDPIGDHAHTPVEGIVHRYEDRALLKLTHVCAVYCRFCFRRDMVGPGRAKPLSRAALERAFAYIAATPSLWEVILTGGDPFLISARRAREITERLAAIAHVKVIRWHTRVPIVEPARVSTAFARALRTAQAASWVAVHANHPRELTPAARAAIGRLVDAGVPVVSQSVLLKGVNDTVETLEALMRAFVEARVKPYYLHHLDLAPGTGHFRVDVETGQTLVQALQDRASGLAQPAYVLDLPGGHGKAPLARASALRQEKGRYRVRDRKGRWRAYPPDEKA
ncbi:MAG: lysine-2,3-aminomutase-like protein [Hyphomonadaceae bacterium]